MYGRRINNFETWSESTSSSLSTNREISLQILDRAAEIKNLVEGSHQKAIDQIKSSQNRQKQIQDNRANIIDEN